MSVTSLLAELRSENAELLRRLIIQQERIKRLEELTAPPANGPIGPNEPMTQWTYNGITYWRNSRNELWHQTFERDIGAWVGVYDPTRDTIIIGLPEPRGVRGPQATVQAAAAPAPIKSSVRRSPRLLAKRKECTDRLRSMINNTLAEKQQPKRAELVLQLLNYMNTNIANIDLMFAASPRFKATVLDKCKEFQKETKYPAVVEAATEFLERYI